MNRTTLVLVAIGLVAPATAQTMIGLDSSRQLSRIDPATGAKVAFATASANTVITGDLAFDSANGVVYLSSTANDRLYALDVNTGTATLVGDYGDASIIMHALAWDSSTDTLYGASSGGTNNHLYSIDKATGFATQVGNTQQTGYLSLCYDPVADVMYAANADTDSFYTIDRHNGQLTLIGPMNGPANPNGLARHPVTGVVYLVDPLQDLLYTIDTATGAATAVGSTGAGNLLGIAFVPPTGTAATFGSGCAGALGVPGNVVVAPADVGSTFVADATNLPLDVAFYLVGFSNTSSSLGALPFDLGPLGASGCSLRVRPDVVALVVGAPGSGVATYRLAIPDRPSPFVGTRLFAQAAVPSPTNALGMIVSDAVALVVGL